VNRRQVTDDSLSIAHHVRLGADAPTPLLDLGAAEFGKARDNAVQVVNSTRLVPGEGKPAT
jgi:hypothetical protein